MTIKKHPEWTGKYTAIDGIAGRDGDFIIKPIRSDIEEILKLNDLHFGDWYNERKNATESLLKQYEIIGSIPSLAYPFEQFQNGLNANSHVRVTINLLKEGLDYLEKIKEVREEYRK